MADDNIVDLQKRADRQRDLMVDSPGEPLPNARRFIKTRFDHEQRPLLAYQGGVFRIWSGAAWPPIDDADLRARLYAYFEHKLYLHVTKNSSELKPFAPNRYKIMDLVDALKAVVHEPAERPSPSWLGLATQRPNGMADEFIACANGLVHVPSRTLHEHTPLFYTHHSVPFDFDSAATQPTRWLRFLTDLWGSDDESIGTLQEVFGYCVSGDTKQQKMFLLVGPKRSGKGTIARVLGALLGAHNVAGPTLASLGTNFGLSPLIGKPVAIVADARLKASDTSIVTERLLSISGEDMLTVDRKFKEPWTGKIPSRIVLMTNELPRLSDSSGALASRFIVLAMTETFYGRENSNLTAELCTELGGIFLWALDGLERLRERGRFVQPVASQEAIRELEDLGSPIGAFVRDECQVGPGFREYTEDLYSAWKAWCEAHGRYPTNAQIFGRDLRAAFPGIRRTQPRKEGGRYNVYQGIQLADTGQTPSSAANNNAKARVPPRANEGDEPLAQTGTRARAMYSDSETDDEEAF
jgi:putative DNA primase/helicase